MGARRRTTCRRGEQRRSVSRFQRRSRRRQRISPGSRPSQEGLSHRRQTSSLASKGCHRERACKRHGCGCQCLPVDARELRPKLVAIAMKLIRCGSSCPAASVRPKQSATSVADLSSRNRGRRKRIRRSGTGGRKRRLQCRSRRRSLRSCG